MKIKGVIFDLDHTLFDRYKTLDLCAKELYDKFNNIFTLNFEGFKNILKDADKHCIHYGWDAVFDYYINHGLIKENIVFPRSEYLSSLLDTYSRYAVKYPFTESVLEFIKNNNLKIGLITNGTGKLQRTKLKLLKITDYFDEILISGEFGKEKPDTDIFYEMSRRLNIGTENLLFVGDHPINDAQASENAGYIPILIKTMGFFTMPEAENFKYCINNISYLPKLISNNFSA